MRVGLSGQRPRRVTVMVAALLAIGWAGAASGSMSASAAPAAPAPLSMANRIVPEPAVVQPSSTQYRITAGTTINVQSGSAETTAIATGLANLLRPSTGFALPVVNSSVSLHQRARHGITLTLAGPSNLGPEAYQLD